MSKYDYVMERADLELYDFSGKRGNDVYYCVMALCMLVNGESPTIAANMMWKHMEGALKATAFFSTAIEEYNRR